MTFIEIFQIKGLQKILDALSSSSSVFSTDIPVTLTGGKTAGKYVNGQTIPSAGKTPYEVALDMYQEYIAPAFGTLTGSIFTNKEVGEPLPNGLQTIGYTVSTPANIKVQPPDVGDPNTNIPSATFPLDPFNLLASGTFQINVPPATFLSTIGSFTIGVQGTASDLSTFSTSRTISYLKRVFWGESPLTALTASDILALSNSQLKSSKNGTYSFAAGNYKWFCYPTSMGLATTFTDTSNGFPVAMSPSVLTVSVTNAFGITENYYAHRTLNILGGSINIAIS